MQGCPMHRFSTRWSYAAAEGWGLVLQKFMEVDGYLAEGDAPPMEGTGSCPSGDVGKT